MLTPGNRRRGVRCTGVQRIEQLQDRVIVDPSEPLPGLGAIPVLGRYWKNSCGSPAQPVARSDSTSSVLPLRWVASTRYGLTARDIR